MSKIDDFENLFKTAVPHLMMARERIRNDVNLYFSHYTSLSNLINIIESQSIWLRSVKLMNDFTEVRHGINIIVNYLNKSGNSEKWSDLVNNKIKLPGLPSDNFRWLAEKFEYKTYIFCLSEHHLVNDNIGKLSMWRAYARGHNGACIVIKSNKLVDDAIDSPILLLPVQYEEQHQLSEKLDLMFDALSRSVDYLNTLDINNRYWEVFNMMYLLSVTTKHPAFSEEREWRIIYCEDMYNDSIFTKGAEIKIINDVPQKVYVYKIQDYPEFNMNNFLLKELVEKIIIGPTEFPYNIYESLVQVLDRSLFSNPEARIVNSAIPFRR